MNVGGGPVDLVGLFTLAALVNFCGFFWSGGIAMRFRTIQAAPLMQMPVFLILFFAPVYVPLELLEGWITAWPLSIRSRTSSRPAAGSSRATRTSPARSRSRIGLGLAFWVWAFRGLRNAEAAGA